MRPGLCERCAHAKAVVTRRGSTFWNCRAPGRPKYPPLPVLRCGDFTAIEAPAPPSDTDDPSA